MQQSFKAPVDNEGAVSPDLQAQSPETVEQQLERQLRQKGPINQLGSFIGVLAEEGQSLEDDLKLLTK